MIYNADKTAQKCYGIYGEEFIDVCVNVIAVQPLDTPAGRDVLMMLLGMWETRYLTTFDRFEVI